MVQDLQGGICSSCAVIRFSFCRGRGGGISQLARVCGSKLGREDAAERSIGRPLSLGATSLATVMQMVASGYGVTLVPEVAVDVEVRDQRVKLLRFTAPEPGRTIGLAWRRTSPRKVDFVALGQIVIEALGATGRAKTNKPATAATPAD